MNLRSVTSALGIYHPLHDLREDLRFHLQSRKQIQQWEKLGRPSPPPDRIKYDTIESYARRFRINILVETGTWKGDSVFAFSTCLKKSTLSNSLPNFTNKQLNASPTYHTSTAILETVQPS